MTTDAHIYIYFPGDPSFIYIQPAPGTKECDYQRIARIIDCNHTVALPQLSTFYFDFESQPLIMARAPSDLVKRADIDVQHIRNILAYHMINSFIFQTGQVSRDYAHSFLQTKSNIHLALALIASKLTKDNSQAHRIRFHL